MVEDRIHGGVRIVKSAQMGFGRLPYDLHIILFDLGIDCENRQ